LLEDLGGEEDAGGSEADIVERGRRGGKGRREDGRPRNFGVQVRDDGCPMPSGFGVMSDGRSRNGGFEVMGVALGG
jgi:hypothetical protein